MALLSFATAPSKGATSEGTLDKTELMAIVPGTDAYWTNQSAIKSVNIVYKSTLGNQRKIMKFDFTQASPAASISFSARARDAFSIVKVVLIDFEKDKLVLTGLSLSADDISLI